VVVLVGWAALLALPEDRHVEAGLPSILYLAGGVMLTGLQLDHGMNAVDFRERPCACNHT